jgi:spore coat protein CotH
VAGARVIALDYVHGDLELAGRRFANVAVRYKGNGTLNAPKKSIKVDLNKYVSGQKLAGVSTLNFHSETTDATWMNESLSYRLFRDAGIPAPRTAYARVYLTITGRSPETYLGLFGMVENVDTNFTFDRFNTRDGAILKPVTDELFADLGNDWARYNQIYDPKTDLTAAQQQRIIEFCRLLTHATDADLAAKLGDYLDLDNFARYMAVVAWSGNPDSLLLNGQNFYLFMSPVTGRMSFIPWDQDHAFGTFQAGGQVPDMIKPWLANERFFSRMFGVTAFRDRYFAQLEAFSTTVFRGERFPPQLDALAPIIRPSIVEEQTDQLPRFDSAVAGQPYSRRNGTPVIPLKMFAGLRTAALIEQLQKR